MMDFLVSLTQNTRIMQMLRCIGVLAAFIGPCLCILAPVRFLTKLPSFIFRKLLHCVAFTGVILMIIAAESWESAALTSLLVSPGVFVFLYLIEREPWFGKLFVQKNPGEIRRSLSLFFLMTAVLIYVSWGIFGRRYIAAAAILMWGTGDAAAALTGVPFGKHKVRLPLTDGKKSWEGSAAMLIVSFLGGMLLLSAVPEIPASRALILAGAGALTGAAAELFSPGEYDTVTVPLMIAAVLLLFT